MKKIFVLLTAVISIGAFSTSVFANDDIVPPKEVTEKIVKEEIQKDLDILNNSIKTELSNMDITIPGYKEFDVILSDGYISTVKIKTEELDTPTPIDIIDVYDVENYKSYVTTMTVNSPFGGKHRGGSLEQKIYYSTLGNNSVGCTKLSYTDTTMTATPPQACNIANLDSNLKTEKETYIACKGYVTIQVTNPWSVFVSVYTNMSLDAGENKVLLDFSYTI